MKNKFSVGDSLELMTPQEISISPGTDGERQRRRYAGGTGDGYIVWMPVPQDVTLDYALLMRNFSGESTRNPHAK